MTLEHTPSRILMQWLIDQGHFALPNGIDPWPLWHSFFPESDQVPDESAAIFDDAPQIDAREMRGGDIIEHFAVSLRLRSLQHETGWLKMFNIQEAMAVLIDGDVALDYEQYVINTVVNTSGVVNLGLEDGTTRRRMFEMMLLVTITKL